MNNKLTFISTAALLPRSNASMSTVFLTKRHSQINTKQSKLLEIALHVSNNYSQVYIKSPSVSQIKNYQIWRDADNVAIINTKTQQLIVFGSTKFKASPQPTPFQNIAHQSLWRNMQRYFVALNLVITTKEVVSSFEFLKPLDPVFKSLNQSYKSN
ncbi:MAG: hypothetical protein ACRC8K_10820 [Waterburya sp.]